MTGVLFPGETTDFVGSSRGFANFDEKRADEFWLLCCITYKLAPESGSDPGIDAHIFIIIRDGEQFRPFAHRLTNDGIWRRTM